MRRSRQFFFDGAGRSHRHAGAGRLYPVTVSPTNLDQRRCRLPDAGRIRVAEQWAQRPAAVRSPSCKTRDITRPNQAVANRVVGDVAGKDCVLVDDLIDTRGHHRRRMQTCLRMPEPSR